MKRAVVDTSVIIDYLRQKNKEDTVLYKLGLGQEWEFLVSVVTVAELWAGRSMHLKKTREIVEKIIEGMEVMDLDKQTAIRVGEILRSTPGLQLADAMIGAKALGLGLPVVTLNKSDFQRIEGLAVL